MNASQELHVEAAKLASIPVRGRRWLRFRTWHLLVLVACVAISITIYNAAIKAVGYTHTTVEIIKYHPTVPPAGSVEYIVVLPYGFSQSAVSIPATAPSLDYSKLVGTKYPMRYRSRRVLWLGPENPSVVAFHLVETELSRFLEDSRVREDVLSKNGL